MVSGGRGSRTLKAHRSSVFETGAIASWLAPPASRSARIRTLANRFRAGCAAVTPQTCDSDPPPCTAGRCLRDGGRGGFFRRPRVAHTFKSQEAAEGSREIGRLPVERRGEPRILGGDHNESRVQGNASQRDDTRR